MNCVMVNNIADYFLDDRLTDSMRAKVQKHLDTCPRCAREVRSLMDLKKQMAQLQPQPAPEYLAERICSLVSAERESWFGGICWGDIYNYEAAACYLVLMLVSSIFSFGIPSQMY